jgi:Flp pilus assembly protein TadD
MEAFRRADELGHAAAASNLGVLLEEHGDPAGAEAAYRRAAGRGDAVGAFNMGTLLVRQGKETDAMEAFLRADELGDSAAASNLGVLLEEHGDLAGAEGAYRRAEGRGDAVAALNLATLLVRRGEMSEAADVVLRVSERNAASAGARSEVSPEGRVEPGVAGEDHHDSAQSKSGHRRRRMATFARGACLLCVGLAALAGAMSLAVKAGIGSQSGHVRNSTTVARPRAEEARAVFATRSHTPKIEQPLAAGSPRPSAKPLSAATRDGRNATHATTTHPESSTVAVAAAYQARDVPSRDVATTASSTVTPGSAPTGAASSRTGDGPVIGTAPPSPETSHQNSGGGEGPPAGSGSNQGGGLEGGSGVTTTAGGTSGSTSIPSPGTSHGSAGNRTRTSQGGPATGTQPQGGKGSESGTISGGG